MCGETFIIFTFASNVLKQGKKTHKKAFKSREHHEAETGGRKHKLNKTKKQNLKLIEIRNSSEGGFISGSFGKGKTHFKDGAGEK